MNAIVRKLKLYRISTVLNYCRNSWDNSAFVIKQCPSKSRFSVFVDLLIGIFFMVMILMTIVLLHFGINQ